MLRQSRKISVYDISSLILSVTPCSQLKLQKLLYLCYADYLKTVGIKMFEEKFYAFKYGPVVKEIRRKYKARGAEKIQDEEIDFGKEKFSPVVARIVFSEQGKEIFQSCVNTLRRYGLKTPSELVEITHTKEGPWDRVYKENVRNIGIGDHIIKEYHILDL